MKKLQRNTLWRVLLILYSSIMLWLLFWRSIRWEEGVPYWEQLRQNTNLIPFHTIKNYIWVLQHPFDRYWLNESIINLCGNVLLFIPAGWLFPRVLPSLRKLGVFLAFCAGVMLLIEIVQLFTFLGCFDVDDLILNLTGMTLGFALYKCKYRK